MEVFILWIENLKTKLELKVGVFSTYDKAEGYKDIYRRGTWRKSVRENPEDWEFTIESCTLDPQTV